MKFHVYKDKKNEHRWSLVSKNGNVIADSAEGYKRRADALEMIGAIIDMDGDNVSIVLGEDPRPQNAPGESFAPPI